MIIKFAGAVLPGFMHEKGFGTDFEIFGKLVYFRRDVEKDEVNPIPLGASGSSMIRAHALSPSGAPAQLRQGDIFSPSHVYFGGIIPFGTNAGVFIAT